MGLVGSIMARVTTEPRSPGASRVAESVRTLAGVAITPDTAVTVPVVWACLRYLSQTVAVLPWRVMRDSERGGVLQKAHPIDWLLWKRPSPEWSSFQFRETLTHWANRWGNGYAEIEPDQLGRPFALWPIHPERTEVCRATDPGTDAYGETIQAGELFYEISGDSGNKITLKAKRMFHIRGFGEGPVGVNVIAYAAQSIGWARAAQLFGASFFGNGMNVAGVVINKKPLKPDGLARQKAQFEALYKGPARANKTAFLDNDADWKAIGIDPEKAQLIEANMFLVEEICRWFGVPPHKVMHLLRSTFNNIEHQAIEVVVDSISPWVKRFEDEADYKLFGQNRQGLYTKMNMRALMRGDVKSRGEYYKLMREVGAYSANRILELEDENTIGADGDKHVMQSQYTTLERIGEEPVEPAPGPAPIEEDDDSRAAQARFAAMMEPADV
jgi:HK97 family phage portal protein